MSAKQHRHHHSAQPFPFTYKFLVARPGEAPFGLEIGEFNHHRAEKRMAKLFGEDAKVTRLRHNEWPGFQTIGHGARLCTRSH